MSEHTIPGGNFTPGTQEGDPGKLEYLHTPGWKGKLFVGASKLNVDTRACPGCMFPDAKPGKWPHTYDSRCRVSAGDVARRTPTVRIGDMEGFLA
jgi:hypothetical protein